MKLTDFLNLALLAILLTGCANIKDKTIAHEVNNSARDIVEESLNQARSYIVDDKLLSISLADRPDPHEFLNDHVNLTLSDLSFSNVSSVLPSVLGRPVLFGDNLSDSDEIHGLMYEGTTEGLLNNVCFKLKCSWSITKSNSIFISKFKTQFWRVPMLPVDRLAQTDISTTNKYGSDGGSSSSSQSVQGGSSTSSVTGTGGQTISSSFEYKASDTIKSLIEPLISSDEQSGEKWSYSPQTGILSVTASNQTLQYVDQAMDELTRLLTASVNFNIKIITYEEREDEGYGLDWNLVWERLGELGVSADIGTNIEDTADQISLNVLESNQPFSGSSAFLNALSEFVTISSNKDFNYSTLSNQVLPFHLAEEIPFAVIESQFNENIISKSYSVYEKSVGLHMNLLPVILNEKELMLEFKFSLSNLTGSLELDLGDEGSAVIPQTAVSETIQQNLLTSGQSIVLTAVSREDSAISKRSPFKNKAWFLGGSKNESREKSSMVVLVTPKIIFKS